MSHRLTGDTKKTLEALKRAGKHGVHSFELNRIVGTTRAAARVNDLIKLGYKISNGNGHKELMGTAFGVRYTLEEEVTETKERWEFDANGVARRVTC